MPNYSYSPYASMLRQESLQPRRISLEFSGVETPSVQEVSLPGRDSSYEARREELQEAEHAGQTALGRRTTEALTESVGKAALQGGKRNLVSAGIASYLGAPTDIVSDLALNPSSFLEAASSGFIGSLPNVATKAAGITGKWATAGSLLGQLTNFVAPGSGVLTSTLGRILGDTLGDAFNARELESVRDYYEDTYGALEGRSRFADMFESTGMDLDNTYQLDFAGVGDGGDNDSDPSGPSHVGEGGTTAFGM